ncbi:MAG TPA: DoxX family protein [Thermoguttaceae bacterium]|nr:DoxX family protein [Thermoguttaceae bacterium]
MRRLLYTDTMGWMGSVGFLAIRLVMGVAFVFHGWPKIQDPTGWMGPEAPYPAVLLALAAASEFGGGIALILGLFTRVGVLGIASVMVTAITTVHLAQGHPFVSRGPGSSYELPAVYLACAVLLLIAGPGRYSLDALLFGRAIKTQQNETGGGQ